MKFRRRLTTSKVQRFWRSSITPGSDLCRRWLRLFPQSAGWMYGNDSVQVYQEKNLTIEPNIAGLLCSAILSDTLMFRSPTCTAMDKAAAEKLAESPVSNAKSWHPRCLQREANLKNKSPEEIFYQDFKKFELNKSSFGVGQITSVNADELTEDQERTASIYGKGSGKPRRIHAVLYADRYYQRKHRAAVLRRRQQKCGKRSVPQEPQEGEQSVILPGVGFQKETADPELYDGNAAVGGNYNYGKANLETGKYDLSASGSDGQLSEGGRETKHHHGGVDGNRLYQPGRWFIFR